VALANHILDTLHEEDISGLHDPAEGSDRIAFQLNSSAPVSLDGTGTGSIKSQILILPFWTTIQARFRPMTTISVASIIATVDLYNSFADGWERLKTYAGRKISTHVNVSHLINFLLKGMYRISLLASCLHVNM
jgi:hypothetical protein